VGRYYEVGKGAKIDYKTAAHWFRRAAEQGYPEGQCNFGDMFYQGKGVAQSYAEAVRWFRLSAGQGESTAFYNLGVCYGNGHGVPQTTTRRCASTNALRPRGTPRPRRWLTGSRRTSQRRAPVHRHERRFRPSSPTGRCNALIRADTTTPILVVRP